MAAPVKAASPLKSKKVLIFAALGLLVVGYLYYKSRSATSTAATPAATTAGSVIPDTSGATGSTDQSSADLLAALAGENQQLMKSFLDSSSGLVSLAGSSVGSPSSSTGAGEPSGSTGFASTTSDPFAQNYGLIPGTPADPSTSTPIASSLTAPQINAAISSGVATGLSAPAGPSPPDLQYTSTASSGLDAGAAPIDVSAAFAGEQISSFFDSAPSPAPAPVAAPVSSGAAGVKAGTTKTNYQAARQL